MKKALALFTALAASVSLAGTGVTQTQLTNAVNAAKTEMRDYVRDATNAVAVEANDNLTNAVTTVFDFLEADLSEQPPEFNPDGSITLIHIDKSLGYPRRVKVKLLPKMEMAYASKRGMKVVSSSYDGIPEGTIFACIGDGTNFYNSAKGSIYFEVATNEIGNAYFHFFGTRSGGLVLDGSNQTFADVNRILVCNGSATMDNLVGSFSVEPYWLDEEEYSTVASNMVAATNNVWVERYEPREIGYFYGFEQLDNLPLSAPSLKAPPKPPTPPPADLPYYQNVPNFPNAPRYDWEEKHGSELNEDEYFDPETWYLKEDWDDPYAWISFPVTVYIPYEYNGQTYTQEKKCNGISELRRYFNVSVPPRTWTAPEKKKKTDYCKNGQHIYRNCVCTKCGHKRSHSYSDVSPYATKCAQCNNRNTAVTSDRYAKGELRPTGDTGLRCTHICDESVVSYHAGWHHLSLDEEGVYNCSCACGHYSPNKHHLPHDYSDDADITKWEDLGDGQHHYGDVYCQRGNCDHSKRIVKDHEVEVVYDDAGEPTNVSPYDSEYHQIVGDCKKCPAKNLTDHLEQHNMVGVEAGDTYTWKDGKQYTAEEPFCYCSICWDNTADGGNDNLHDIFYLNCGTILNCIIGCARCGKLIAHNEHDFTSEDRYVDEQLHDCYCGLHQHKHLINDTDKMCEGGYHWVQEYDQLGNETGGQWVEVSKGTDNGCGHDFNDDPDKGSDDIPCDSGNVHDPDDHNAGEHISQGQALKNPVGTRVWRSESDPCPYHRSGAYTGGYVIEWDREITLKWVKFMNGPSFLTGVYPVPVQWGTKHFSGNSKYKPKSFRVMRYAAWLDWWREF